ncbi:MAG: aldehyde-activating protein [Robiginitomaculum sp.]|nr:MAG: aldehyde-activating protein [Robiginitomaculum sp.]
MKNKNKIWHKGGCHCGAVTFEVCATSQIELTACNCSICDMTGFQHLIVTAENFRLLTGADNITTYTFNTHTAKHTFCQTCGVKPFYRPRSHPDGYSVNFLCVNQSKFETVTSEDFDGRNWEDNIAGLRDK